MNDKIFFPFYDERIGRVVGKLQSGFEIANFWSENIRNSIAADLYEVFHKAAVRCLIAELHRCKDSGLLYGETAEEEYDSYCNLLKNVQYVDNVYQKYPGLSYYLDKLEEIQVCFWEELLGRLVNDWEEIKEYFYIDAESHVLSIRRSGSDFHCNGKSVVIIETGQKKILYKPHPIGNEIFLQTLLADIYRDLGLKGFFYLELDKKSYGWAEEVTWEECGSNDEVIRFYKRVGVLAAAAYVLGIGDLHYENIIAHGEFPVIIDVETLFQHMEPLYQWKEKTTDFYSVLSSGLFPGGTAGLNTAGITGGDGCISSKKIPVIMYDKTSEMCVDYQKVSMPKGKNHVRYQGKAVRWESYEQKVLEGFRSTYEWFRENKDKVLEKILDLKDKLRSRYVSGGTQFFGLSLFASVHPELMTSIYGRKRYMEKIFKDRKLGNQEIEAVLRGDIPCFFRKLTDQSIYDGQKIAVCDFFKLMIAEKMEWRLKGLCVEDRILQEKVIAYSIKVFNKDCEVEKEYGEKAANDEAIIEFNGIECAKDIADYIAEKAYTYEELYNKCIFWGYNYIFGKDIVGILMDNSVDFLLASFAIQSVDSTAFIINSFLTKYEIESTLNKCSVDLLLTQRKYYEYVQGLNVEVLFWDDLEKCKFDKIANGIEVEKKSDIAVIMPTSGTTDVSKFICLSHETLLKGITIIHGFSTRDNESPEAGLICTIDCKKEKMHIGSVGKPVKGVVCEIVNRERGKDTKIKTV